MYNVNIKYNACLLGAGETESPLIDGVIETI